ncbi:Bardet-Biedl syndrome 1 protein [Perkinsus chesapeaki]|uniref:Bardet-Biedl syndrome 1 protein n=1 Tax=Perkinsus chesapeaki TaxID=330153 RepID=A0A7J6L9T8_PERCH|nr:Bardet-Biedl syndrome 1 protein [Perkinsus chesapeaki]
MQGTKVVWEQKLLVAPVAVRPFHPANTADGVPSVAVVSGPHVFIYRHLKPHMKFTLPPIEVTDDELKIWKDLRAAVSKCRQSAKYDIEESGLALVDEKKDASEKPSLPQDLDIDLYLARLHELRDSGIYLSIKTHDILAGIENPNVVESIILDFLKGDASADSASLQSLETITCLEVLKKTADRKTAASMLVAACESGTVFLVNPSVTGIALKIDLPEGVAPAFMAVSGVFELEYRIFVATRSGKIISIKNGQVMNTRICLDAMPVGLVKIDKLLYLGCMDMKLHCFHFKGKKMHTLVMPSPIVAMEDFSWEPTETLKAMVVGLRNGEIRVYNGRYLVNTLTLKGGHMIYGMCVGSFGREDATMAISTKAGSVIVKILHRDVKLNTKENSTTGPPPEQDIPLNVPKKTRLYIEQTQREREQPVEIHRAFQRDLCKLRLRTIQEYVQVLNASREGHITTVNAAGRGEQAIIKATVQGMGPHFRMAVTLTVKTQGEPLSDKMLLALANTELYRIEVPVVRLPLLVPDLVYSYYFNIKFVGEPGSGLTDAVKLLLLNRTATSSKPEAICVVHLAVSDVDLE